MPNKLIKMLVKAALLWCKWKGRCVSAQCNFSQGHLKFLHKSPCIICKVLDFLSSHSLRLGIKYKVHSPSEKHANTLTSTHSNANFNSCIHKPIFLRRLMASTQKMT